MGQSNLCLKITFIAVQLFFIACGLALIGVGVWLEIDEQTLVTAIQSQTFLIGPYLLIAVGCGIVLVSVIGIIGAACSKSCNRVLLILYIILVFIIFLAEIAGGILAYIFRAQANELVIDSLRNTIEQHYNKSGNLAETVTRAVDSIQQEFDCCGVGENVTTIWNTATNGTIPPSCCPEEMNPCLDPYTVTCNAAILSSVSQNLLIVATLGVVLIVAEVIVFLLAICLVYSTEYD